MGGLISRTINSSKEIPVLHLLGEERHDVVLDYLVNKVNKLVHGDHRVVVHVQLEEIGIIVLLCRLDALELEVALDETFELAAVDSAVFVLVRTVEDLLQL